MLSAFPHQLMFLFFPAAMAAAAAMDLLTMTIPNRLSAALAIGYFVVAFLAGAPFSEIALHAACGVVILVFTFTLFTLGWIGGGDAKLAAATAVWIGWANVLDYGLGASVFGGVLTLAILVLRRWPLPQWLARQQWLARLHEHGGGVPYGIALAAAGLFIYPDTQIWLRVIGA